MELCGDIKDGAWTDWEPVETERCVGVKNIGSSNYTCGASRTTETKICARTLGGKQCPKTGTEVLTDVMVRTVPCQDVLCPGETLQDNVIELSYQTKSKCSEWENAGECIVEPNRVLGSRKQTLSYENYRDERNEVCYKNQSIDTGNNIKLYRIIITISFLSSYPGERHNIRTEDIDQRRNHRAHL